MKVARAVAVAVLVLVSGLGLVVSAPEAQAVAPPTTYVPLTVWNNQSLPTGVYQQLVHVDSAAFAAYLLANDSNLVFFYPNGTLVPSWIQDNASATSTNTTVFLKLDSIGADATATVDMGFASGYSWSVGGPSGAYPNATVLYGQGDDGAQIFDYYTNFSGVTLPSGWYLIGGLDSTQYTVFNGLDIEQCVSGWTAGAGSSYDAAWNDLIDVGVAVRASTSDSCYFDERLFGTSNSFTAFEDRRPDGSNPSDCGGSAGCFAFEGNTLGTRAWPAYPHNPPAEGFFTMSGYVGNTTELFQNYTLETATAPQADPYYGAWAPAIGSCCGDEAGPWVSYLDIRTGPPNDIMPAVAFGAVVVPSSGGGAIPALSTDPPTTVLAVEGAAVVVLIVVAGYVAYAVWNNRRGGS